MTCNLQNFAVCKPTLLKISSKPLRIPKILIYSVVLMPVVFCFSLLLLNEYDGGDQIWYTELYNELARSPLNEMPGLLKNIASSSELLTGYILWVGAKSGINKNAFIASLNVLLYIGVFLLARRHKASWIIVLLLLTNFYLLNLAVAAERQKIAYICMIFAMISRGYIRKSLLIASPFAHLVSLVFFSSALSIYTQTVASKILFRVKGSKVNALYYLLSLLAIILIIALCQEAISGKALSYLKNKQSITEFCQISLLLFGCLFITSYRLRLVSAFCPLYVCVYFFGGSQFNMIAVIVALYLLLIERRLNHPLAYVLMVYCSLKSIPFVQNIFLFGDGFFVPPDLLKTNIFHNILFRKC